MSEVHENWIEGLLLSAVTSSVVNFEINLSLSSRVHVLSYFNSLSRRLGRCPNILVG